MRPNYVNATMKTVIVAASVLLLATGLAVAQQVALTAAPSSITLPDGQSVPMWGYSCGTPVAGSNVTCAKLNPASTGWSPVVITVPTGTNLQVSLTNGLIFSNSNSVPTSLVIVGQLGGGLGSVGQRTTTPSPTHDPQGTTWPIANAPDPTGAINNPPPQGARVQSFATEVAAGATTTLPAWSGLKPGTYLIESGTHPSIQGPMGLYGILVVTTAPAGATAGTAYPGVSYNAEVPLLFSEIDPIQNTAVQTAVNTSGFSETKVWSGQPGGCGNPSSSTFNTCYPPAVNYTPLYYLINGAAFDKTNASASLFPASAGTSSANPVTGSVLVRLVNAGLRMHVPSIVGSTTGASAVGGFGLIAEDGNPLPGVTRVQSEVFMAAGKTYDVMINVPAACVPVQPATTCTSPALPIFDRELSLSGNAVARDAGMLAYIGVNGAVLPSDPALTGATANPDTYNSVIAGQTVTVSDASKGVIANDVNVYGVKVTTPPSQGTLTLNANGTFTYVANAGWSGGDSFTYCGNGATSGVACTMVTLGAAPVEAGSGITCGPSAYTSNVATSLSIKSPGILSACTDAAGYPLNVDTTTITPTGSGWTVRVGADGSFIANVPSPGTYMFTFKAKNSQGTQQGTNAATVSLNFNPGSGLAVTVLDGKDKTTQIHDYRWIIEEDRTFYIDRNTTTNTGGIVPTFGTNFHTSYMPVVAQGCVGPTGAVACESGQTLLGVGAVCDIGNGICRTDATQQTPVDPSQVVLDPTKRYYISVLPGDGADPFNGGDVGHGMGGAPIAAGQTAVTVLVEPTPLQTAKLSVFVFEDDFPLNGENDAGGGAIGGGDIGLPANEPALGGFEITLFDDAGGTGDSTGQMTYDMFNMPLSNSLAGTIDPITKLDACPIAQQVTANAEQTGPTATPAQCSANPNAKGCQKGITGRILTCPNFESDGKTYSPLAGQAIVANLMPGRYGVVATPGADRIARGEEWLQTNTLDGQKAHDSFLRVGEPAYFQEFGPAGYHVSIGFANPAIINSRLPDICAGTTCNNSVTGRVTTTRMSRTPDERLYSSGSNDSFGFTQCYVSLGDPDGQDFAFTKCDASGNFTLSGLPDGTWRVTVFDQWNDMLVDGLSTPVALNHLTNPVANMGDIATNQWQANIYTSSFIDIDHNGVRGANEPGLSFVATNIRFRDGSFSNFNSTDLSGNAGFNEVFPLFSWYVIETDSTRYKNTGTHVAYDAGGPSDGNGGGGSTIGSLMANTAEAIPLPANLRVPGAVYCDNADCNNFSILNGPGSSATGSTGRIDPPWVVSEGWQGFSGQNSFLEFGKAPYAIGENGGIKGHVIYASTRPFDDPQLLLQLSWEPMVPNVTINLYQEGTAADGSTSLKLVDTTKTSSFDDWAQGFRSDGMPNMNCPGQGTDTGTNADLFYFSLFNQPNYLDVYNSQHGGPAPTALPANSQFKCYDGMHNWNQVQPAPYDGMYQFPSVTSINPTTGKPAGTNCTICAPNHAADPTDWNYGLPMLPDGKYVVEVVVPPGYELVKEEDKNILIGDNYIAPVTQQFAGLGNVFILPDQAEIGAAYNANNAQNGTQTLGRNSALPSHEGDTGSIETFWPCVGESRIVPDFISLFPQSAEVAPFAGATRNLCDRKEVTLTDQTSALAKFYLFTSTHVAAHFTGVITDDFTSEFDPFSPQFGEKFAPPDLPISIKDFNGNEISRVYTDHWGAYNGLTYSTWEVNPPNPTGYAPTMMVTCMNDPGTGPAPDPLYNPQYSQFCYEIPFMPGQTQYMDTPVVPVSAFASAGYNNPDCAYPDATPAIASVTSSDIAGPWVSAAGASHTLTITALGDQTVPNNAYSGPSATTAPYNQKTVTRHYGFGSAAGTVALVGSDGVSRPLTGVSWSDTTITGTVPTIPTAASSCSIQQQAQYKPAGTTAAQCAQLVITAANGRQSIDAVTVTIGGKKPTVIPGGTTIQSAIDAASPGDMLIVPPGTYNELLLMWKPIRLQGVGAASTVLNANTHPAGKLDPWRRQVNCLFGLAINGTPISSTNPYDGSSTFTCTSAMQFAVDRIPLEAVVGWDASLNGNLPEQLQEPSLMGAYEGAGITVLGKGVNYHGADPYASDAFPTGTTLLTGTTNGTNGCGPNTATAHNPFPSNFLCNPSSIDGLSVTNSSQGGGGIFVHGWGHNIQIANNRVHSNSGTLAGGIAVGQGEFPPQYLQGSATNAPPGSCQSVLLPNTQLPYCFNLNVNVHNNYVTSNSSLGDELFSATPSGAGGVAFCTGADNYKFQYNWICGNLSTGDGGGVAHIGFSYNGDIEHNSILFNQSTNPTIPTNGGGIAVLGAPDTDPVCGPDVGANADADCAPGTSDGTGPNLLINANLIMGNSADSGSGGGIRLHGVNGTEVTFFPLLPSRWYSVNITNNIITNNVAGWDGAGVSLQDALVVNLVNNTIASNDTTASAGILFNTLGAPLSSSPGSNCIQTGSTTASCPQPAGVVAIGNSPTLMTTLGGLNNVICPAGHFVGTALNGTCRKVSYPELYNNVFWQNRAFYIGVGNLGSGGQNQQNVVALYNAFGPQTSANQAPSQPQADATTPNGGGIVITGGTGACPSPASYWDIGVRGDTGPSNHGSGFTLTPTYSVLTDATDYSTASLHNTGANPTVVSQYCNGSRVPPELGTMGYQVPPGIADATVPNPIFSLAPSATVDEGNNWINMSWGPLALTHPLNGSTLGNYALTAGSPAINYIPSAAGAPYNQAPSSDFFGNPRKTATNPIVDAGAVEFQPPNFAILAVTPTPLAFGNLVTGTTATQTLTLTNSGGVGATGISVVVTTPFSRTGGTCGTTLAAGASCTIIVQFAPTAVGLATGTATITASVPVAGSPVQLTGTGVAPIRSATVTPSPLDFGNWATGTTSNAMSVTVTNTGNVALAGGTYTLGGGTPQPFARPAGAAGGTCGATLAVGASCTVNLTFAPGTTVGAISRTLTVAYTGATVTPTPVTLTGTGVAARATVSITPAPLTITLPSGTLSGSGTVTLMNTAAAGGSSVAVSNVAVAGAGLIWAFTKGTDNCTGTNLAPGASCTVQVTFSRILSIGTHVGTITFTDTATGSPQARQLIGVAQ